MTKAAHISVHKKNESDLLNMNIPKPQSEKRLIILI